MESFLKSELEGAPPGVSKAVLKQLENAIRAARSAIYYDKPEDINLRCVTICARLANTLEFLAAIKQDFKED